MNRNLSNEIIGVYKKYPQIFWLLSETAKQKNFPFTETNWMTVYNTNIKYGFLYQDNHENYFPENITANDSFPITAFSASEVLWNKHLRSTWRFNVTRWDRTENNNISIPVVTAWATHALRIASEIFIDKTDEIIVPNLYWQNYDIIFNKEQFVHYSLFDENQEFNLNALSWLLLGSNQKKVLLLNFPHNPTWYNLSDQELKFLCNELKKSCLWWNSIVVILDNCYEDFCYEQDIIQYSLFERLSNLDKNLIVAKCDSFLKSTFVWWVRIWFLTVWFLWADREVLESIENKIWYQILSKVWNISHLDQVLVDETLNAETFIHEKMKNFHTLQNRYKLIKNLLETEEKYKQHFKYYKFNSAYFFTIKFHTQIAAPVFHSAKPEYQTCMTILSASRIRIAYNWYDFEWMKSLLENIYEICENKKENT